MPMPVAWFELGVAGVATVGRELSTINTTAGLAKARASITIIPAVFLAAHANPICQFKKYSTCWIIPMKAPSAPPLFKELLVRKGRASLIFV